MCPLESICEPRVCLTRQLTTAAELRTKTFLVLPPRYFQVVCLFFLAFGFPFWALLLVKSHSFGNGELGLCVAPFRTDDQPQGIGERGTNQFERVLRIFPRGDGLLLCVIWGVRP